MSQFDVKNALERLIAGELRAQDAVRMATEAGYQSFVEFCEAELSEEFPRVRLDRNAIRKRIALARGGRLSLEELRAWAEELAAFLDRHELGVTGLERRRLTEALALVAVATDARIFRNQKPVLRVLESIVRALARPRAGNLALLYGSLFEEQTELHLVTRRVDDHEGEDEEEPTEPGPPTYLPQAPSFLDSLGLERLDLDLGIDSSWSREREDAPPPEARSGGADEGQRCADVVALNRPYVGGSSLHDYEWVVAFSVATRALVNEDTVPSCPAPGFIERAVHHAPNFDLQRYRPEARRDQDGVLEIVLDAPTIGRAELLYAAKLFALVNRVGTLYFEGRRLPTLRMGPRPRQDGVVET